MISKLSSSEALQLLVEGNRRFSSGLRSLNAALSVSKMHELAERGQSPFAIVLTCSDSRVPTEMVFDQGLGDLFVIRIAGNVVSPMIVASVEYAASVLGCRLCVVMGHSLCGAVATAVDAEHDGEVERALTPDLSTLVAAIRPAVREARKRLIAPAHDEFVREATIANMQRSVRALGETSDTIRALMAREQLAIVGAIYDLRTGVVSFDGPSVERLRLAVSV